MTNLQIAASPVFVSGFNYRTAEKAAAETLRVTDAKKQEKAKLELKAGMMAAILKPDAQPTAELAAYIASVLAKAGKDRTETEARAENAARTRLSRLMDFYGIPNLDKRGGSANAKKRGTKSKAAPAKQTKETKAAPKVQLATYVSPDIKAAPDFANHLAFVTKNLNLTLRKAEPFLNAKQKAAVKKELARFATAMKKIMGA